MCCTTCTQIQETFEWRKDFIPSCWVVALTETLSASNPTSCPSINVTSGTVQRVPWLCSDVMWWSLPEVCGSVSFRVKPEGWSHSTESNCRQSSWWTDLHTYSYSLQTVNEAFCPNVTSNGDIKVQRYQIHQSGSSVKPLFSHFIFWKCGTLSRIDRGLKDAH